MANTVPKLSESIKGVMTRIFRHGVAPLNIPLANQNDVDTLFMISLGLCHLHCLWFLSVFRFRFRLKTIDANSQHAKIVHEIPNTRPNSFCVPKSKLRLIQKIANPNATIPINRPQINAIPINLLDECNPNGKNKHDHMLPSDMPTNADATIACIFLLFLFLFSN
jgi:hypothetical protein